MKNPFIVNGCDGLYNSFDIHFTSACDNKCAHCIDSKYQGIGIIKPDVKAITDTIIKNQEGYDDVLFLGGEPCLFLEEMLETIKILRKETNLKLFVTTAVPKVCKDKYDLFLEILDEIDGMNLSVQHHNEKVADEIRKTKSQYDRQEFYRNLPHKEKIRINLNIVKPYLYTKKDITDCLNHYDKMGFNSIKLSEIQHGKKYFVSFAETFGLNMKSPYTFGCQKYMKMNKIIPGFKTPVLLKRSCFMCESTLNATALDGLKVAYKKIAGKPNNKYSVIYSDGRKSQGWI